MKREVRCNPGAIPVAVNLQMIPALHATVPPGTGRPPEEEARRPACAKHPFQLSGERLEDFGMHNIPEFSDRYRVHRYHFS